MQPQKRLHSPNHASATRRCQSPERVVNTKLYSALLPHTIIRTTRLYQVHLSHAAPFLGALNLLTSAATTFWTFADDLRRINPARAFNSGSSRREEAQTVSVRAIAELRPASHVQMALGMRRIWIVRETCVNSKDLS
jgi:hypothetical protein